MPRRRARQPAYSFDTTQPLEPARRCRTSRREQSAPAGVEAVAEPEKPPAVPTPPAKLAAAPEPKPKPKSRPKRKPVLTDDE